jgi:hypothetical protein
VSAAERKYPTKAKVEHAIRMAKLAGIDTVGSIELGPDGTIRIAAAQNGGMAVADEIAQWREKRGR